MKVKGDRAAEDEMVGCISDSRGMNLSKLWEIVKDRETWHAAFYGSQKVRHNLVTEQHNNSDNINS